MKLSMLMFSLLLTTHVYSFSWGANGHRIVAQICEDHLTEKTKSEIKGILGKEYLAEIANWPDFIKSEKEWNFTNSWHYTTINMDQTFEQVKEDYKKDKNINDAIEAIELMKNILQEDKIATQYFEDLIQKNNATKLGNSTKATALAFLVHLIGDIHQPLHVGKNKDQGGNKIAVEYFGEKTNIHTVWDSEIIEHERLSYTEFAHFINKLSKEEVAEYQSHSLEDWAQESIVLREFIYNTLYDYTDRDSGLPSFSWQFQHDNINFVEERLLQAGVRLAGLLNEIFNP